MHGLRYLDTSRTSVLDTSIRIDGPRRNGPLVTGAAAVVGMVGASSGSRGVVGGGVADGPQQDLVGGILRHAPAPRAGATCESAHLGVERVHHQSDPGQEATDRERDRDAVSTRDVPVDDEDVRLQLAAHLDAPPAVLDDPDALQVGLRVDQIAEVLADGRMIVRDHDTDVLPSHRDLTAAFVNAPGAEVKPYFRRATAGQQKCTPGARERVGNRTLPLRDEPQAAVSSGASRSRASCAPRRRTALVAISSLHVADPTCTAQRA